MRQWLGMALGVGLGSLMSMGALAASSAVSWRPQVRAPEIQGPPVIDGVLNDSAWVHASLADAKVIVDLQYDNSAISQQASIAYLAYDRENLYVAAVNYDMTHDLAEAGDTWGRDPGMEIDLAPHAGETATVVQIFPNGRVQFGQGGAPGGAEQIKVSTQINKLGWIAEVVIPFSALGLQAPGVGTEWEFNVGALSDQWKAWKSTGGSNFLVNQAGTLVFGPVYTP